ncbi:unnamed protein product [Larinioides sclopetarius]|uniref:Vitellogenin receptor n=1 Tax=Larinioides sclopetarius TaxID=280406 RepID=A0AAV2BZM3_9ARAC
MHYNHLIRREIFLCFASRREFCDDQSSDKNGSSSHLFDRRRISAFCSDYCRSLNFKCLDGGCLMRESFCDGLPWCKDGSDERYCGKEARIPCPANWVRCPSSDRCIPFSWLCDGIRDCNGRVSEERNCTLRSCSITGIKCPKGNCIHRVQLCNYIENECQDNSDQQYCGLEIRLPCPDGWVHCPGNDRCIPSYFECDGFHDCGDLIPNFGETEENNCTSRPCSITAFKCPDGKCISRIRVCDGGADCADKSDEMYCGNVTANRPFNTIPKRHNSAVKTTIKKVTAKSPEKVSAKTELRSWILSKRKSGPRADRWGPQVHRIAVALHLDDESTFISGNNTGEEIRYSLTLQLLQSLGKNDRMNVQDLALYIHGLLVACMDPRDFYGEDLVRKLRKRVEEGGNYTRPFLILALCNAGDAMTSKDVERVINAYNSKHRPFWTDTHALASMALACISSRSSVSVDKTTLMDMLQELKRRQLRNGTVDNFKTTAISTQALFIHDSYKKEFDLDSAMKVLIDGLKRKKTLLNTYYSLPVLNQKSLLNVTSGHCKKEPVGEEDALQKLLDVRGETMTVHYSVWMSDEINLGQTWILKVGVNSTIYDAIETVVKIDSCQNVEYNVVDGKPYVASLNGKENDPEMEIFWFIYLKNLTSDKDLKIVEESPVDTTLQPNQEIILWYKRDI